MNRKIEGLLKRESIAQLRKSIYDSGLNIVNVNGLYSSAKAFAISEVVDRGVHLVVLQSKDEAAACVNDLYNIIGDENVYFFPTSDVRTIKGTMKDMSAKVQRTAAVSALADYREGSYKGKFLIIAGYKEAFDEYIPSQKELSAAVLRIVRGSTVPFEKLQDDLYGLGFTRVDFVSRPGEYAVRGGIIDLFSYNNDKPYRLDFFGDEVDSVRMFDVNTQHTTGDELEVLDIYPNMVSSQGDDADSFCSVYSTLPDSSVIWISGVEDFAEDGVSGHKKVYLSPMHKPVADVEIDFNTSPQPAFNKNFELLASDIKSRRKEG